MASFLRWLWWMLQAIWHITPTWVKLGLALVILFVILSPVWIPVVVAQVQPLICPYNFTYSSDLYLFSINASYPREPTPKLEHQETCNPFSARTLVLLPKG
jgi:hypothetical protein